MELNDRIAPDPLSQRQAASPEIVPTLVPADVYDRVVETYKKDIDRTLLIENLKLTPQERSQKFEDFMKFLEEVRKAGRQMRGEGPS
jgi:hypothetical protein